MTAKTPMLPLLATPPKSRADREGRTVEFAPQGHSSPVVVRNAEERLNVLKDGRRGPVNRAHHSAKGGGLTNRFASDPKKPDASRGARPDSWRLDRVVPLASSERSNPVVLSD